MKLKSFSFIVGAIIVLVLGAIFFLSFLEPNKNQGMNISTPPRYIIVGGRALKVEIADNSHSQILGLSGRPGLAENTGMLFVFENSTFHSFWMKDMLFSLDIIWITDEGKIVGIEESVSPDTFPESFYSPEPVRYVLEVEGGWAVNNSVKIGDNVIINPIINLEVN